MLITKVEKIKKKYHIYIDEEYVFCLYFSELNKFKIKENNEISRDQVDRIVSEVIIKRGINYIYNLISKRDYTYFEYQNKLIKAGYTDYQIPKILKTFSDKGFINDENYVARYFEQNKDKKSINYIIYILRGKGIELEIIKNIICNSPYDEIESAKRLIEKRLKYKETLTYEEKIKNFNYLLRKGYQIETIRKIEQLNI